MREAEGGQSSKLCLWFWLPDFCEMKELPSESCFGVLALPLWCNCIIEYFFYLRLAVDLMQQDMVQDTPQGVGSVGVLGGHLNCFTDRNAKGATVVRWVFSQFPAALKKKGKKSKWTFSIGHIQWKTFWVLFRYQKKSPKNGILIETTPSPHIHKGWNWWLCKTCFEAPLWFE